jgi:ABC-type multidrug transport system ATPase subunit
MDSGRLPVIDVVNVTHHYGIKPVLRDVSIQVNQGEVLALMGPNGTGKSTLMQVMAGVIGPYRGFCRIDGKQRRGSEAEEVAIRRKVAYLPAESWLPGSMSGREWLLAVGRLYDIEYMRLFDHVERLLSLFDLASKADSPMSSYSTGQQKKISLAGALVTEAPILLLDEPFSGGLDPTGIIAMRRVLQHAARSGQTTIVIATPVPELVEEVAHRIAILRDARVYAHDTIEGLRAMAGGASRLDEVYQVLANPEGAARIDEYFIGRTP